MKLCPACSRHCPLDAGVCPHCEAALDAAATGAYVPPTPAGVGTRFSTGDELAGRYRIVALLGAGGMGEVYRAHDNRLDQDVALKLLPDHFASNPYYLSRFREEVRTARQVTHANVCRVYDLGEHQGHVFLTMEFIAGDDLRSLLRRVERLPEERAVEVARQLCAAVVAVHDQGLLHRDLKPANVLIDDKGNVRLLDFGIAALAGKVADVRSGTVAYQAPEVLAGREVTIQSDLFALGLVLYELFTGKAAFPASSRDELERMHESGATRPSGHLRGLDAGVERVILRCLENNPANRPRSAGEVQAALPGALRAAVAAGETPSPDFVADAGGTGSIPVWLGGALLAVIVVGMVLVAWLTDKAGLHRRLPLTNPTYLNVNAQNLAKQLGYSVWKDNADGVLVDHRTLQPAPTPAQWRELRGGRPVVLFYWYRQRPELLVHRLSPNDIEGYGMSGMVTVAEPTLTAGEVCLVFDGTGRLIELHARPPLEATARRADWKVLFDAAGLKANELRTTEPVKDPGTYADERAAWLLPSPDDPEAAPPRLRVEAAARGGWLVYFWVGEQAAGTDDRPAGDRSSISDVPADLGTVVSEFTYALLRLLALTVGAWMAWKNVRRGVANRTGAFRLAAFYGTVGLLSWLFLVHHTTSLADEWAILAATVGHLVLNALTLWVIYLALEPSVRRHLPEWMIGWNRLLDGRWRDPAVGRDMLFGAACGVLWAVLIPLQRTLLPEALGQPFIPYAVWTVALTDGPLGLLLTYVSWPLFFKLLEFFLVVILFLLSGRRLGVAVVCWVLIWTVPLSLLQEGPVFGGSLALAVAMIGLAATGAFLAAITLVRVGLLGFVTFGIVGYALVDLPITLDMGAWYRTTSCCVLAALAAVALFAFTTAIGGLRRLSLA